MRKAGSGSNTKDHGNGGIARDSPGDLLPCRTARFEETPVRDILNQIVAQQWRLDRAATAVDSDQHRDSRADVGTITGHQATQSQRTRD